ncbi:hypothetical protein HU830_08125 [Lactobacillus sp. DCY120]|uniref:YbbR-like protein n=1 Tax=Bombilactobacillus apium TaxID=2675299 RepID=A0A850RCS0_9LACO|nr:CdaR family protein [Bombilactobacillus apium]NVY97086.1 hypothetical protein [Bombilactobacillus apium]
MKYWRRFAESKYFYIVLSLGLAIWIYVSISSPLLNNTRDSANSNNVAVANKSATITMNLQVNANTQAYFITGYPKQVTVKVKGPAALVTATKNTQNFTTYIDLNRLGVGKHRVRVKQRGLNRDLTYQIKPSSLDIKIEPRLEETFPIQTNYDRKQIATGYQVHELKVNPQVVQVIGARSEVERVSQVVAQINVPKNTKTNFQQEVLLQALDIQGHTLSVLINPQTTNVKIPISLPNKTVNLKFVGKNTGNKNYTFNSNVDKVQVYAKRSVLEKLTELEVPVDVTKADKQKSQLITIKQINSGIIDSNPSTVKVIVKEDSASENNTDSSEH